MSSSGTHHSQDIQEQVDEIQVERERTKNILVRRQAFHDRVRIIHRCEKTLDTRRPRGARGLTVSRKEQHSETSNDQVGRVVERKEYLHETRDQHAHQSGKQIWTEVGKVVLPAEQSA